MAIRQSQRILLQHDKQSEQFNYFSILNRKSRNENEQPIEMEQMLVFEMTKKYQITIQKFLQSFQRLYQYNSQTIDLQKRKNKPYPFILHYNNGPLIAHIGPEGEDFQLLGQERLQDSFNYFFNAQRQIYANKVASSSIGQPSLQNNVKIEELQEEENNEKKGAQINNQPPIKTIESIIKKFTQTPYLSQINVKEEAIKVRQRYRLRQEGKVTKRIRKTKDQVQVELRQGIDPKETKNIPKNYAKAIMVYLLKNDHLIDKFNPDPNFKQGFIEFVSNMKLAIQNIKQFKAMLSDQELCPVQTERNRIFRIISRYFLKNHAISYIFNSRITQKSWHIKYRSDLLQAVKNPLLFRKVKPKKGQNL